MIRALPLALVLWLAGAGAAAADPVFTPIAIWVATSLPFVAAAVDTFVFFAVQAALYAGSTWAITKLTTPQQRGSGQERQASVLQVTLGEHPREAVIGECVTAGGLVDAFNHGGAYGTDWENLVIALADHPIHSLVGYYIGDTYHAYAGDGLQAGFNNQLAIYVHHGEATQAADAGLISSSGGRWTTAEVGRGVAYVVVSYKADDPKAANPVWSTGRPQFLWRVKGAYLYDPRKDSTVDGGSGAHRWTDPTTWEWSDNPALARYRYTRGFYADDQVDDPTQLLIGRGLSAEEAPPERVIAQANLCDELVALKAGGSEKRYRCSGVIRADEPFGRVDEMFAACMAGVIVQREGTVEIDAGVARSVVVTLTDGDLLKGRPVRVESFVSDADRVNTVTPRYIEPDQIWREVAAPVRRSTDDIQDDGGLRPRDLSLSLVTSQTQAQRCGEIERRLARKERRASISLGPRYSSLEEGDWIAWQSDRWFGGSTVTFRIEAHSEDEGLRTGLILREIAASCYDWDEAVDESTPGQAPVDEPGDLDPLELGGAAAAPYVLTGDDGSEVPAIRVSWTAPVDPAIHAVRVEVRKVGEAEVAHARCDDPNAGEFVTDAGVIPGTDMEARLVPLSAEGRRTTASAWLPVTAPPLLLAQLEAAVGDGVLNPGEKLSLVPQINGLVDARAALRTQADALNLLDTNNLERAAYETAADDLDAVLATLTSPVAWDNRTGDTTVAAPADLVAAISDSLTAERNLQTVIAETYGLTIGDLEGRLASVEDAITDGVLTPNEKFVLIPIMNTLIFARAALRTRANALGLTVGAGNAERIAFENAAANLDSYLAGLTAPVAWNNYTDDTAFFTPSDFRTYWQTAYQTTYDLQSKIDGEPTGGAFGVNLTETAGGAVAALSGFKTSLGTAAAISGQSPWATYGTYSPTYVVAQVQWLDTNGQITDWRGMPVNVPIGFGGGRTAWPLASTSSSVTVTAGTEYRTGTDISAPGSTVAGLSADTLYDVFYFRTAGINIAVTLNLSYLYMKDQLNYVYLGRQATQTGGGTYSPPPTRPGGAYGGGSPNPGFDEP